MSTGVAAPPLTEREIRAAEAMRGLLDIPYCPHDPMSNRQQTRYLTDFRLESLYGGAAGGGKSDALLMGALQFVDIPGYAALLLRRRITDLRQPGALLDRADHWFSGQGPRWKGRAHTWAFPSGAKVVFGFLDEERDKYRYQSAEFQYIGFDELTQFSESQYRYMFTRLRRPQLGEDPSLEELRVRSALSRIPLRMRAASNPGGRGHEWVRRRWQLQLPAKMREELMPATRSFVKATLLDNPFVDAVEYRRALGELDPITRAQMEHGDWVVRPEGQMIERQWFKIITIAPPDLLTGPVRYWDLAATERSAKKKDPDWTAGALCSRTRTGQFVIHNVTRFRKSPGDTEETIRGVAERDGKEVAIWIEQEPGSSGKSIISHYRRNVLPEFIVQAHPKTRDKVTMAAPWAGRAQAGEVSVMEGGWVTDFFDEAESFPSMEHDDQIDAVSGAYAVMVERTGPGKIRKPTGQMPRI
jgi:predicted phage terminase large subunit-like protein